MYNKKYNCFIMFSRDHATNSRSKRANTILLIIYIKKNILKRFRTKLYQKYTPKLIKLSYLKKMYR